MDLEQKNQLEQFLQQVQLTQEAVEVEEHLLDQDQLVMEDQELLLLNKFVHLQHIKTHQESGQLMTHIITRKLDNGQTYHQCQ